MGISKFVLKYEVALLRRPVVSGNVLSHKGVTGRVLEVVAQIRMGFRLMDDESPRRKEPRERMQHWLTGGSLGQG